MEQVTRSFTYVFEDKDWPKKIAIGAFFTLAACIVIGIPFVLGYILEAIRNIRRGEETPLPEWDNLDGKFWDGLKLFAVALVYAIVFSILRLIAHFIPVLGGLIALLLTAVFLLALMYIMVRYADTCNILDALNPRHIMEDVPRAPAEYAVAVIVALAASLVSTLGMVVFVVGVFFTAFYGHLVVAHAAATAYTAACGTPELLPEPEDAAEPEQPDQEE